MNRALALDHSTRNLALGIPALLYVIYAFSTGLWMEKTGLIILSIIGALY